MITPVEINSAAEWAADYSNLQQGAFAVGSALYAMVRPITSEHMHMYSSTNQGLTWTLEDAAGEPSNTTGAACSYDGGNTVWVAWGGPPSEGGLFLYVAAFDTATNTWGTPFRNELVDVGKMLSVCFRSDGTLFMGYLSPDTSSGLAYSIFDTIGSTFTALSVELAPGILTLPEYSANVDIETMVLAGDAIPATTIYYAYQTSDVSAIPQMQNGIFFSTFTAGDAITNFFTVPGQIGTPSQPSPQAFEAQGPPFMGPPAVCGAGNVVIPMAQLSAAGGNYASLYVSTNGGVSWTLDTAATGIDPGVTPGAADSCWTAPGAFWSGSKLYCVYAQLHGGITPASSIRVTSTTPDFAGPPSTWTWTATTALDYTNIPGMVAGTDGFTFPNYTLAGSEILFGTNVTGPGGSVEAWFIILSSATAGGRLMGTFVGFVTAGQCSGGVK